MESYPPYAMIILLDTSSGFSLELNFSQVKSHTLELAKLIENEDGVAAAVDAFHRHLPSELPLSTTPSEENDHPNALQWFFLQIGRLCCLPCSLWNS